MNQELNGDRRNHHVALFVKVIRFDERFYYKFLHRMQAAPRYEIHVTLISALYFLVNATF
ncbi:hypothetical protein LBWT_42250 [Leptolyngbya boryana IAM M-101]|nr:hypothetical protein LBWT_42250 [Leptolyngbya boryana IAM M-101]BAS64610.1 hypothetical protein LBDG_42250 [Leptolyngbya boryana dg5]